MTLLDDYSIFLLIAYGICRHYHNSSSPILAVLIRVFSLMASARLLQVLKINANVTVFNLEIGSRAKMHQLHKCKIDNTNTQDQGLSNSDKKSYCQTDCVNDTHKRPAAQLHSMYCYSIQSSVLIKHTIM